MSELSVCLNEVLTSLIYTILASVEVSFHWQGRLLLLDGYNHLYYISGLTSLYAYYNYIMTNLQKGSWSFTVFDMINQQWGLIQ